MYSISFLIGSKLRVKPLTVAVAAKIYHQFYEAATDDCYDPYVSQHLHFFVASHIHILFPIEVGSNNLSVCCKQRPG